jgi:NAD(P)-dependent dehydrogenase (short-subunit alcohol dehydrogenase family)
MSMTNDATPVWFITGCSTGFGLELAKAVIARGWRAVVTARDKTSLSGLVQGHEQAALAVGLDVTKADQIKAAVAAAEERFGRIDVLVNNAGYGYQSAVEEGEEDKIRAQFDANVFGLFAMTRAVLPLMRRQRSGHIINVTSIGGLVGYPASGYYSATKHAVEGWSDSLAKETGPLGIKVTCVEPGPFRTDWAGRSLIQTPNRIADYAETAGARMKTTSGYSGSQPGDPAKAAEAMIRITQVENPPRHLPLGPFAVEEAAKKAQALLADIEQWRELALATSYAE